MGRGGVLVWLTFSVIRISLVTACAKGRLSALPGLPRVRWWFESQIASPHPPPRSCARQFELCLEGREHRARSEPRAGEVVMGTPYADGGLRSEPESQLGPAAARSLRHAKPCPSFLFKQLCVCHSCDSRDLFGTCISGLSINQILFIRQTYPRFVMRVCTRNSDLLAWLGQNWALCRAFS